MELAHTPQITHQGKSHDYHNKYLNGLLYCPQIFLFLMPPPILEFPILVNLLYLLPKQQLIVRNSFFASTTRLWNSLPANYVHHDSVGKLFKILSYAHWFTVKTFGLLQPYFGYLSCMPVVCVTHYKTSKECFLFVSKIKCS